MSLAYASHMTNCGLPGIDSVPFGTHACHFYRDRDELISALVPCFIAGLAANERCIWVTASPLPANDALEALRAAWSDADNAIEAGKLSILDFDKWYESAGHLQGLDVVRLWLGEEERALAEGYNGLRITGNMSFLTPSGWPTFMEYETAVTTHLKNRRIIALCSYGLTQCTDPQIKEIIHLHDCALEHADAGWRVVPRVLLKSYRCYFIDGDDHIQTYKQIDCKDDAEAALKAQQFVASSQFAAVEVWHGKQFIGRWSNPTNHDQPFEGDSKHKGNEPPQFSCFGNSS